ncbi:MAG: iron uptake protein [Bacteroidota bacterium]
MVLGVVGGYLVVESVTTLLAWSLAALGMARGEAVVLAMMLAFVLYLIVLIWAIAERRLWRLWLGLGGGAFAAIGIARVVEAAIRTGT